jgi:hypothetical protein
VLAWSYSYNFFAWLFFFSAADLLTARKAEVEEAGVSLFQGLTLDLSYHDNCSPPGRFLPSAKYIYPKPKLTLIQQKNFTPLTS